jgi:hypothetical protein
MTLTADHRSRSAASPTRAAQLVAPPRPVPVEPSIVSTLVLPDVYRATDGNDIVGYVQLAGPVYVVLLGAVYNTSVEIAQCLDLAVALDRLRAAAV